MHLCVLALKNILVCFYSWYLRRPGQLDGEDGPDADAAFHQQLPVVPGDNVTGDAESQAGPFTVLFGRKKRFKDPFPELFGNAVAVVRHRDIDKIFVVICDLLGVPFKYSLQSLSPNEA